MQVRFSKAHKNSEVDSVIEDILVDFKDKVDAYFKEGNDEYQTLREDVFEFSSQFSFPNKL